MYYVLTHSTYKLYSGWYVIILISTIKCFEYFIWPFIDPARYVVIVAIRFFCAHESCASSKTLSDYLISLCFLLYTMEAILNLVRRSKNIRHAWYACSRLYIVTVLKFKVHYKSAYKIIIDKVEFGLTERRVLRG